MMNLLSLPALLVVAALSLAACQSSEERAEERYQSGLALLAEGDEERAMIEFRNVFTLDGFHKDARKTYADLLIKRGDLGEATGQYLRLIEQYPDTGDVRRNLAVLAILRGDWDQAERQGGEAAKLLPEDVSVKAVTLLLGYRKAVVESKPEDQATALAAAETMLADPATTAEVPQAGMPGAAQLLRRLLIGAAAESGDTETALPLIDASLEDTPDDLALNVLRLQVLNEAGDMPGVGAQLRSMVDKFPENSELRANYIGWLMSQRDFTTAEAFLREKAGDLTGNPEGHVPVVQLLYATQGIEAARAEVEKLLAANSDNANSDLYGALLAGYDFESGDRPGALERVEDILAKAEPTEQTRRIRLMQARMLATDGDTVGARAEVETVLKDDPSNVEALKMRAGWLIQSDDPGGAIIDLRAALDQAPRDPAILTLMAEAHERDGAKDLAGERLAMAVEVSSRAAPESLRYAAFLQRDGRGEAAIAVLNEARQANPTSLPVLQALAQLHIAAADWPKASEIASAMQNLGDPASIDASKEVKAAVLLGQGKTEEGMSFLSDLAQDVNLSPEMQNLGDRRAVAVLVQTMVRSGQTAEARIYLDGLMADEPDDAFLTMMSAGLHAISGQLDLAETEYRALIEKLPDADLPVRTLYGLLIAQEKTEEAQAVLDAGLKAIPDSAQLLWIHAGQQERAGEIDAAIATYEKLYARDTGNMILANNLASLLTTWRNDPESLDRAYAVARRLRGTNQPALADTYGWIAYRRGDYEEALPYLETAARGLATDPVVQVHLGLTYAALNRPEDAKKTLRAAVEMAGPESTLAPIVDARAKLAELGG